MKNVVQDVMAALYASRVQGVVVYHAYHLKLCVSYGEIGRALNVIPGGGQLAQALALITEDDHKNGRPLSTACVINLKERLPGAGFFTQARELGYEFENESEFWQSQLSRMGTAPFLLSELDELKPRTEPMKAGGGGLIVPGHVTRLGPGYKNRKPDPVIEQRFPASIKEVRDAARKSPSPYAAVTEVELSRLIRGQADEMLSGYAKKAGVRVVSDAEMAKSDCDTDEGPCACGTLHVKEPASGLPT